MIAYPNEFSISGVDSCGSMAYFLQLTTEENLYICILDGLWGSKTNKLAHWTPGDQLIVYVERALAAIFSITGESYYDPEPVWPGDLYPYRIPIRLEKIIHPALRPPMSNEDIRRALILHHSRAYGIVLILGAQPLADAAARVLLGYLVQAPAWDNFNPGRMLQAAVAQRLVEQAGMLEEVIQARPDAPPDTAGQPSLHTQMQFYLAQLGHALGFQGWIPKADQHQNYHGTLLAARALPDLPPLPFNESALRIIRNIDVIWLRDEHPAHLFEVEHTTTVYSGLLRMSDLVSLIPALNIDMYIVAPTERKTKVAAEANRPTFARRTLPLAERCRFIPFEKLADFMDVQHDYLRHFNLSILDELSESLISPPHE